MLLFTRGNKETFCLLSWPRKVVVEKGGKIEKKIDRIENRRVASPESIAVHLNHIALGTATPWSFGRSECNRVNVNQKVCL